MSISGDRHDDATASGGAALAAAAGLRPHAVPGTSLRYYRTAEFGGGAPPLILLHPWFGSWAFWLPPLAAFGTRTCYLPDLYSAAPVPAPVGPVELAAAVARLIDHERMHCVDVVGNSVGGIVAQLLANELQDRIGRLVLVGTGARTAGTLPGFKRHVDDWVAADRSDRTRSRAAVGVVVDSLAARALPAQIRAATVDAVCAAPPGYVGGMLARARELDLRSRLPLIPAPTLVIRGSADCARTHEHVRELLNGLPDGRAVEMAGTGHSPMLDDPAGFAALVVDHLDRGR
jgi:pimeloyl-ACP methyl ester carboxylesterase